MAAVCGKTLQGVNRDSEATPGLKISGKNHTSDKIDEGR